jgi:hypothetical protein
MLLLPLRQDVLWWVLCMATAVLLLLPIAILLLLLLLLLLLQDVLWWVLYKAEAVLLGSRLRKAALAEVMKHVHYEDENTRYVDIGPVNKVINMLCCWFEDPDSMAFKK